MMPDNTLTIELEGDVPLAQFAETLTHLYRLVHELTYEVAGDAEIEWLIDDLRAGSARTTIAGFALDDEPVQEVIRAYERVGEALQSYETIPYSQNVVREARAITTVISDKVTAIRFETARKESIIYGIFDTDKPLSVKPRTSIGAVKGRVETISRRRGLKFTLYDSLFDRSVTCYLQEGQEEKMRNMWGKLVFVTGHVTRDPETGQAKNIRNITAIDPVLEVEPGSYKIARGILAWLEGDEPAEVSIRRLRNET